MTRFERLGAVCGWLAAIWVPMAWAQSDDDPGARAKRVLSAAPVCDGHNDLPWVIREKFGGDLDRIDLASRAPFDTDIPRLSAGKVGAQFWSVYVPSSLAPVDAVRAQLEQIDLARRMIEKYPGDLSLATSVDDVRVALQQRRIASLLGIEGGHTIVNSLGTLRAYYDLGVRYMTLTHFHGNDWADSATDEPRHGGLSPFGLAVVAEMNRLGMLIDLSHVSAEAMHDALDATAAPVIFSHSSARALTGHARNVPDEVLNRMPDNGGVVMVTFIPEFVNEQRRRWGEGLMPLLKEAKTDADWERIGAAYREQHGAPPPATLGDVADHIEHVARVAGHDHVGIGSDFYGAEGDDLVQGLEDVSRFPALFTELARRGWSDDNLARLSCHNLLRAFAQAERVAARLGRERPASLETP